MRGTDASTLVTAFLHTIRRRLWIEALCARQARAAWAGAGVVVAGATCRLVLGWRTEWWTALIALVPLAVAPALALWTGGPSLANAARRADLWFDGAELLTSAHDQLRRAPAERAGAADFVIARAGEAVLRWRALLETRALPVGPPRFGAPIAVALIGGFLYLLPAAPARRAAIEDSATVATASGPPVATHERNLLAWRDTAGDATPTRAPSLGRPRGEATPDERGAIGATSAPLAAAASGAPSQQSAGEGEGGRSAGSSAPRVEAGDRPANVERLATTYVDIPRPERRAGSGSVALEPEPARIDPLPAAGRSAASARVALTRRAFLAPALRAYLDAYRERSGASE